MEKGLIKINKQKKRVNKINAARRDPSITTGQDLVIKTLAHYQLLKEHLERNNGMKDKVLDKREEVMKSDWAENMTIIR